MGYRRAYRSTATTHKRGLNSYWTVAPMTVERATKRRTLYENYAERSSIQPAPLVRGNSRRIMSMRFRSANISVINRRASSEAVIGPAVPNPLKAHQRDHVPAPPPVEAVSMPERCSPSRVRFAAPNYGAPLTAARRSGQMFIATGGSGGNMRRRCTNHEKPNLAPESLTRSLHISSQ